MWRFVKGMPLASCLAPGNQTPFWKRPPVHVVIETSVLGNAFRCSFASAPGLAAGTAKDHVPGTTTCLAPVFKESSLKTISVRTPGSLFLM